MNRRQLIARTLVASGLGAPLLASAVAPAASPPDIVIGQTAALTGPFGAGVKLVFAGAALALAEANSHGGIGGRQVRLVTLDDHLSPEAAAANCTRLIEQEHVVGLFGTVGGGAVAASLPLLQKAGMPLIAPYALPDPLREHAQGVAYCTTATFGREIEALVQHLTTIGITRIGLAHVSVASSVAPLLSAELEKHHLSVAAVAKVSPNGADLEQAVKLLSQAQPQAVILLLDTLQAAHLMSAMWAGGGAPSFYGTSLMDGELIWKTLNGRTRGFVVAQVTPYPWNEGDADVRNFQALCKQANLPLSYQTLCGYVSGRVLVEGLKRAGHDVNRASLSRAMHSLNMRVAGMDINFTGGRPTGSRFVELVQVTEQGRFMR